MALGVLAFGDSITNGGGELQWGVALQSWALWLARGLGMPYTGYAVDGAVAYSVVHDQIPRFQRVAASPDGPYDVGCLYIGANDVRGMAFDASAYERDLRTAAEFLAARCEHLLVLTIPPNMGRPPSARNIAAANAAIRRVAAEHSARVCDLGDFGARNHLMADSVHPTAFGQIAIAERALRALGLPVRVWPHELIHYEPSRLHRLRGDLTYAYRRLKAAARERLVH